MKIKMKMKINKKYQIYGKVCDPGLKFNRFNRAGIDPSQKFYRALNDFKFILLKNKKMKMKLKISNFFRGLNVFISFEK